MGQFKEGLQQLRSFANQVWLWLKSNVKAAVVSGVLGALLGFLINYIVIVFVYDGNNKVPHWGPVPNVQNGLGTANLYRTLVFSIGCLVLTSVIGYWWQVGNKRFFQDLKSLPQTLGNFLSRDGKLASAHILWGACLSLILSRILAPWLTQVLAVGILLALPSVLGRILCSLGVRLFSALLRRVSPVRHLKIQGPVSVAVMFMGGAAALLLAHLLNDTISRLGLALVCFAGAVLIQRKHTLPAGAKVVLFAWISVEVGLAHDGGYWEKPGNQSLWTWIRTTGRLTAENSTAGGVIAGLTAPFGVGIGSTAAQTPSGWNQETDYDEAADRRIDQLWKTLSGSHFDRLVELQAKAAETGRINISELDRLERDFEREVARRREEIDRQHEQFAQENRAKTQERLRQEREAEAQARSQEARRQEMLRRGRGLIDKVKDPVEAQRMEDFLSHHSDDPEKLERAVAAIRNQTYEAEQQRNMGESEQAQAEADAYEKSEKTAESIRDNALRANRIAAKVIPGGERIVAAQEALYGASEDYARGGLKGVAEGAATNLVDDRTGGLGTAFRETVAGNKSGETTADRLARLGQNWGRTATEDKNPLETLRRLREAEDGGDVIDILLDTSDAAEGFRGDSGSQATDSHSSGGRGSDSGTGSTRPPRSMFGRGDGETSGSRRPSDSRGDSGGKAPERGSPMREETHSSRQQRPRAPQTPPVRDERTVRETLAQQAQRDKEEAQRALGQAEMDRDEAKDAARQARARAQEAESNAQQARADREDLQQQVAQSEEEVSQAREGVLDPDNQEPGQVDRYTQAQEERRRLEAELAESQRREQEAEAESQAAQEQQTQAAQDYRDAESQHEQARTREEAARREAESARAEVNQERGPDYELRQAQGRLDDALDANRRAQATVAEAEQSGDPGKKKLAQDALNRAQDDLRQSQQQLRAAQDNMERQVRRDERVRESTDQAIRDAQQEGGVDVQPLPNPGQHRTLTPQELANQRAQEDGQNMTIHEVTTPDGVKIAVQPGSHDQAVPRTNPEKIPQYDERDVRGQSDFTESGDPSTVSTGAEGTNIHERIHAHAHPSFRQDFPTTNSTRNFHEGITEYFTRQTVNSDELSGRDNIYPRQRAVIEKLASRVGHSTLSEAYFNGRTDALYNKLGYRGNVLLNRLTLFMQNEDYAGAHQFIDSLEIHD